MRSPPPPDGPGSSFRQVSSAVIALALRHAMLHGQWERGDMSRIVVEFRELERFITVIEAQSMTVAARRLGMTQSAVSQTINALEQKLGVSLIDRAVRPLTMTVPGRILFER